MNITPHNAWRGMSASDVADLHEKSPLSLKGTEHSGINRTSDSESKPVLETENDAISSEREDILSKNLEVRQQRQAALQKLQYDMARLSHLREHSTVEDNNVSVQAVEEASREDQQVRSFFDEIEGIIDLADLNNILTPAEDKVISDRDLTEEINKLIGDMEEKLKDPFMDAAEKIDEYYRQISAIRDLINKYALQNKDTPNGYVRIQYDALFTALKAIADTVGGMALYPVTGTVENEADAEAWAKKLGAGKVVQDGNGWKVVIDVEPLNKFIETSKITLNDKANDGTELTDVSQTMYNNFMSAMDNFLQAQNTIVNKITNQLDYYTKLLNNVRETISQYYKDMCQVAMNVFNNSR